MHDDQLVISLETVRELIADQFPQWGNLAVRAVDSQGTVNAIFRIGSRFAARFALRPGDAGLLRRHLESEASTARELAGHTRFRTSEPVALGEPGAGYPFAWLVQTWLPGVTATAQDPGNLLRSRMTWPSSSVTCVRSTRAAGGSAGPAEAARPGTG